MLIRTEEGHPSQRAYLCLQQVRTLEKLGIPVVPGQSRISGQRQTHLDIALGRSCVDSPGHAAARRSREGQRLIQRLARFSETPLKHLPRWRIVLLKFSIVIQTSCIEHSGRWRRATGEQRNRACLSHLHRDVIRGRDLAQAETCENMKPCARLPMASSRAGHGSRNHEPKRGSLVPQGLHL